MKKARFWILMSVYLVLVLADGALTYYNTPDLSMGQTRWLPSLDWVGEHYLS